MSVSTVITALAEIKAKDDTGPAFAAVEKRATFLERMLGRVSSKSFQTAARMQSEIGAAERRIGSGASVAKLSERVAKLGASASHAAREVNALAKAEQSMSRVSAAVDAQLARRGAAGRQRLHSLGGNALGVGGGALAGAGLGGGLVGLGAAGAAALGAHQVAKQAARIQHERVRMQASGMTPEEIDAADVQSGSLSRQFRSVDRADILHMIRNTRSIVGGSEEAAVMMPDLLKLRTIAQAQKPGEDTSEDFDQLVKGLEIKGVTQNPEEFKRYMQGIAKGLNVFGDTLKPHEYYEMMKYGRQATPRLSEDFILGVGPTLSQEMRGSSFGKSVSGFNSAVVAGVLKHSSLREFARLGLVAPDALDKTSTGAVKGLKPGRSIDGWQLAQLNPLEWVKQHLLPALSRKGITDADQVSREITTLFQNQSVAQLVSLLATQQQKIEKDISLIKGAQGLEAAETYTQDLGVAAHGVVSAMHNLAAEMGKPFMGPLAKSANVLSDAMNSYAENLRHNRDITEHPEKYPKETAARQQGYLDAGLPPPPQEDKATQWGAAAFRDEKRLAEIKEKESQLVDLRQRVDELASGHPVTASGRRFAVSQAGILQKQIADLEAGLSTLRAQAAIGSSRFVRAGMPIDFSTMPSPAGIGGFGFGPGGAAFGLDGNGKVVSFGTAGPSLVTAPLPPVRPAPTPTLGKLEDIYALRQGVGAPVQAELRGSAELSGNATVTLIIQPGSAFVSMEDRLRILEVKMGGMMHVQNGPGSAGISSPDTGTPSPLPLGHFGHN